MPGTDISSYIISFSYLGIFLWFAVFEQLTPIPEEVSLMSLGYISVHNNIDPFLCGIFALAGLMVCDNLLFYLSYKGNKIAGRLLKKINPALYERIKSNLEKHSRRTLFISALLPKLRFFSPLIAAAMNISWKQFLVVNGAATLLYATFYMLIGIFFHSQLSALLAEIKLLQHGIFIFLMIALAVFITIKAQKMILKTKTPS